MHNPSLMNQWLAMESVAFQEKVFGRELEAFFTKLRLNPPTPAELKADTTYHLTKGFHDIVKKHTNMSVHLRINKEFDWIGFCMQLPALHVNHVFIDNQIKPLIEMQLRKREIPDMDQFLHAIVANKGKNTVNLISGKVTGIWEDISTLIGASVDDIFSSKYTVAQLAALSLHEIGHLFTYFEHFGRTTTSNMVITGLAEELEKTEDGAIRTGMFQDAAEAMGVQIQSFNLTDKKQVKVALTELMTTMTVKSSTASSEFDKTSVEALADQYAARHGYALELATALEAGGYMTVSKSALKRASVYMSETVMYTKTVLGMGFITAVFMGIGGIILTIGIIGALVALTQGTAKRDFTYDKAPVRIKRMREQLVQLLKNEKLDPETQKQTLMEIKQFDELIKTVTDEESLLDAVVDFFKPFNSVADRVKLHRRLEELGNNDLFVMAAKLRNL